jgi:hypothetical protein
MQFLGKILPIFPEFVKDLFDNVRASAFTFKFREITKFWRNFNHKVEEVEEVFIQIAQNLRLVSHFSFLLLLLRLSGKSSFTAHCNQTPNYGLSLVPGAGTYASWFAVIASSPPGHIYGLNGPFALVVRFFFHNNM